MDPSQNSTIVTVKMFQLGLMIIILSWVAHQNSSEAHASQQEDPEINERGLKINDARV